ncbi:anti-sigma factor [Sphingomonas sp. Leaf17]|uniref:anti-sigma factor n=1 Tax=Sphingomonas sp. Leaf17 TaxID=1735683 RepID=UPI000AE77977|nr:anti-sigma factor [Sphingomonas sp. Leaf17]
MTPDLPPTPGSPESTDPDMQAAELALGLLEGSEKAAALRRVLADPDFARDVDLWRSYFAQFNDQWPTVEAPATLEPRVMASIAAPAASAVATKPVRRSFGWSVAAVTSAIAASLAMVLVLRPNPVPVRVPVVVAQAPAAKPLLLASLAGTATPAIPAAFDSATGTLRIAAVPETAADRVAQLWIIGGDGVPHSLGLMDTAPATMTLAPADRARLAPGGTLAISVEPLGGSPTALPTGPVVATGVLARV